MKKKSKKTKSLSKHKGKGLFFDDCLEYSYPKSNDSESHNSEFEVLGFDGFESNDSDYCDYSQKKYSSDEYKSGHNKWWYDRIAKWASKSKSRSGIYYKDLNTLIFW